MKRRVKTQLARTVFFSGDRFIRKNLHGSNRPIPRHIHPWFQIHHGRLQPRLQNNTCRTHEKLKWPGASKRSHDNPQPTLQTRASTKNSLSRQQVPNSPATIHDRKRRTLPTRSTQPAQKKFGGTCNADVQKSFYCRNL